MNYLTYLSTIIQRANLISCLLKVVKHLNIKRSASTLCFESRRRHVFQSLAGSMLPMHYYGDWLLCAVILLLYVTICYTFLCFFKEPA